MVMNGGPVSRRLLVTNYGKKLFYYFEIILNFWHRNIYKNVLNNMIFVGTLTSNLIKSCVIDLHKSYVNRINCNLYIECCAQYGAEGACLKTAKRQN